MIKVKTALISVSDKSGIVDFAKELSALGVRIISTGGTAKALADSGLKITEISDFTGFPEMMDGRVKTLHPKVHGGLLSLRDNAEHQAAMKQHNIEAIDMVVVNLYPFEETVAKGAGFEECVENIDIGGPSMIRSAAKNHKFVAVVTDPKDYAAVITEMKSGGISEETGKKLAAKAYAKTGSYDAAIGAWFAEKGGEQFPETLNISAHLKQSMRYGENPHQKAAYYEFRNGGGISGAKQLQGKELSYNNVSDADAAWELVQEFDEPAVAIIKHANPCGTAIGKTIAEAYKSAFECDSVSAFGGIVALNRPVNDEVAKAIADIFYEVIIAPDFSMEAMEFLGAKKNLRLLKVEKPEAKSALLIKSVSGGLLVQEADKTFAADSDIKVVTLKKPSDDEMKNLKFAMKVVKHVKSNAIVIAHDLKAIGIGAGQMSRVKSVEIACEKAVKGAVLASDAFFPFADNIEVAAKHGISAVIQPGGSMRDKEVIEAADKHGISMVFSGLRHFRH